VRILVAVGHDGDPESLGPQPAHVRVERWVDQPQVLRQCSVVVSHGGSGTFLGALAEGRPQLCMPQAADQFRNAEGGLQAGAALVLMPGEVAPPAVVAAVSRLLDDPSVREAAARVAEEIASMPSPEQVVDNLVTRFGRSG
jgi:UDP:flavonoid glycosyltransferase YjiC (YdhE family)